MKLNCTNQLVRLGYNLVDEFGYYKFHTDMKNWTSAVRICEEEGAHLLILDSDDEAHKVRELFKVQLSRRSFSSVWVGVHFVQGKWMTVLGEYCILMIPHSSHEIMNLCLLS